MTNPLRLTKGGAIVGKMITEQGIVFGDGTTQTSSTNNYYGQISKQTTGTITIATSGTYISTGLTGTLSSTGNGVILGTTDTFAIKNNSGETRVFEIFGSMDALTTSAGIIGIKLAKNGTAIDETECRAYHPAATAGKLVTNWMISLAPNDEIALFVANHTNTETITFARGRIVAKTL
jgi:hypothetical protein